MNFDPRFLAGPVMMILGASFLFMAVRLWILHPVNRVFRIGPFVTERGMKALLRLRLTSFAIGAFLCVYGAASIVFWFVRTQVNDPLVQFLGSLATGLGLWAAGMMMLGMFRLWKLR